MPVTGLEPVRPFGHQILSLRRLPFRHTGSLQKASLCLLRFRISFHKKTISFYGSTFGICLPNKKRYRLWRYPFLEAPPGFEPGSQGFADPCLTTWLWRQKNSADALCLERETRFEPATSTLARWRSTTELFPHNELSALYWWKL